MAAQGWTVLLKAPMARERNGEPVLAEHLLGELARTFPGQVGMTIRVERAAVESLLSQDRWAGPREAFWPESRGGVDRWVAELEAMSDTYLVTPIGVAVKVRRAKAGPRTLEERETTAVRVAEMWRLHDNGLSDKEIALALKMSKRSVLRWRGRFPRAN